jgi:hypothetical protein
MKDQNDDEKFERSRSSEIHRGALVQLTARLAIHLQFDISANALQIRALQSPQ